MVVFWAPTVVALGSGFRGFGVCTECPELRFSGLDLGVVPRTHANRTVKRKSPKQDKRKNDRTRHAQIQESIHERIKNSGRKNERMNERKKRWDLIIGLGECI